jgi:protein-S-isoprenylcysteine O-methyltransferase Ste14
MQVSRLAFVVPPPLFYVIAFGLGLLIERWAPSRQLLTEGSVTSNAVTIAGVVASVGGALLGPLNAVRFLFKQTTLIPSGTPTMFFEKGIYAVSRNPMYLGLFLIYVGIAMIKACAWPLVTMAIPFLLLDRIVVPFEERRMAEAFGSPYVNYCSRVGRWITVPGDRA